MNITYQKTDVERFKNKFAIPQWGKKVSISYYYFNSNNEQVNLDPLIKQLNPTSILDYGCGRYGRSLKNIASIIPNLEVTYYDPFVEEFKQEPEGTFDIVVCFNVLNTVKHKFIPNVIKDLYELSNRYALVNIIQPERGFEQLGDLGEKSNNFVFHQWDKLFEPYFTIRESHVSGLQNGFIADDNPIRKLFWVLEKKQSTDESKS